MADTSIVDRNSNAAALSASQYDANLDSMCGVVEEAAGTTYAVDYTDQNKTIELNNGTMTVTMGAVATILAAIATTDFKVTLKNTNAADATINRGSTDTIDGALSISLSQYESVTLQTNSGGNGWNILSNPGASLDIATYDPAGIAGQIIGLTATQTLTNKTLTSPVLTSALLTASVGGSAVLNEDTMASNSATKLATQKSIKAYVDSKQWNHVGTITTSGAATYTNTSLSPGITTIRLLINGVSTSASTQQIRVRLGSGSFPTSGTAGTVEKLASANTSYSSGYAPLTVNQGASEIAYGITDMHITTAAADDWIISGHIQGGTGYSYNSQGVINLGGNVDRIEISVVSGTFDGGSIVIWEM